jgi:sugar O-acyltransferase (sialic acid O-acetyltransferase NeuD family)
MDNIIIVGSSGHAKVIIDIIEKESKFKIIGLLDRFRKVGEETLGYRIIGGEEQLPGFINKYDLKGGIVAIGDNYARYKAAENIMRIVPGFVLISAIHPGANISKYIKIGEGTVIMAGSSINSGSVIGRGCILNTNSSLDHDSVMEDYSSLAPNSATGGNVHINSFSAICIGATIKHGVNIGKHSVVGAGSVVLKDIGNYKVAFGIPAREIRDRKEGDKYL